jgi:hypothetical protein
MGEELCDLLWAHLGGVALVVNNNDWFDPVVAGLFGPEAVEA